MSRNRQTLAMKETPVYDTGVRTAGFSLLTADDGMLLLRLSPVTPDTSRRG